MPNPLPKLPKTRRPGSKPPTRGKVAPPTPKPKGDTPGDLRRPSGKVLPGPGSRPNPTVAAPDPVEARIAAATPGPGATDFPTYDTTPANIEDALDIAPDLAELYALLPELRAVKLQLKALEADEDRLVTRTTEILRAAGDQGTSVHLTVEDLKVKLQRGETVWFDARKLLEAGVTTNQLERGKGRKPYYSLIVVENKEGGGEYPDGHVSFPGGGGQ